MQVGAFGLGDAAAAPAFSLTDRNEKIEIPTSFYRTIGLQGDPKELKYASGFISSWDGNNKNGLMISNNSIYEGQACIVSSQNGGMEWSIYPIYTSRNTTKGSDGTLKAASPVIRIANPDASTRTDIDEDGFEWCGYGVANDEARGVEIVREDVGFYRITGALSLASSGWTLFPPRDPAGSGDMGIAEAEQDSESIVVRLYKRRMVLDDEGDIEVIKGKPIDVPVNSWIDVRLDMPEAATSEPVQSPAETA